MSTNPPTMTKPVKTTHLNMIDDDIRELGEFLDHQTNTELREQTLDFILKSFSSRDEDIEALVPFGLERPIIRRLADSSVKARNLALSLLVNLTAEPTMLRALVQRGLVDAVMDYLLVPEHRKSSPRLPIMILNNVTLNAEGAMSLMQEGKQFEGLHVARLMKWFVESGKSLSVSSLGASSDASSGMQDEFGAVAGIFANLGQLQSFRQLCLDPKRSVLLDIKSQIVSPSETRRIGILRLVHNLANDYDKHAFILDEQSGLFTEIILRLVHYDAENDIDEEEAAPMLPAVRAALRNPNKKRDPSKEVRMIVLGTLYNLVRNAESRKILKAWHIYQLIRELHHYEREIGHDEADEFISETLIEFFILFENEDEMRRDYAQAVTRMNRQIGDSNAITMRPITNNKSKKSSDANKDDVDDQESEDEEDTEEKYADDVDEEEEKTTSIRTKTVLMAKPAEDNDNDDNAEENGENDSESTTEDAYDQAKSRSGDTDSNGGVDDVADALKYL